MHPSKVTLRPKVRSLMARDSTSRRATGPEGTGPEGDRDRDGERDRQKRIGNTFNADSLRRLGRRAVAFSLRGRQSVNDVLAKAGDPRGQRSARQVQATRNVLDSSSR